MLLLIFYTSLALGVSFLCSVAEAVLLSVSTPHIALLEQQGKPEGARFRRFREDINKPLAAILTLNTIAHTVGAAGAGAQAAVVFGNAWVGIASGILTLLILVFSEIIPKTLGAAYWRELAPVTSLFLKGLTTLLYPFVIMSEALTRKLANASHVKGMTRDEFAVMAKIGHQEGQLQRHESKIIDNLILLSDTPIADVMTPRPVIFSLPTNMTVGDYFAAHEDDRFSRIPLYTDDRENLQGYVLRDDLLLAQARLKSNQSLDIYRRELIAIPKTTPLLRAYKSFIEDHTQIMLVVNEYGETEGIVTLEDILETLLGMEIVDEGDKVEDMQKLARKLWRQRAQKMGLDTDRLGT